MLDARVNAANAATTTSTDDVVAVASTSAMTTTSANDVKCANGAGRPAALSDRPPFQPPTGLTPRDVQPSAAVARAGGGRHPLHRQVRLDRIRFLEFQYIRCWEPLESSVGFEFAGSIGFGSVPHLNARIQTCIIFADHIRSLWPCSNAGRCIDNRRRRRNDGGGDIVFGHHRGL